MRKTAHCFFAPESHISLGWLSNGFGFIESDGIVLVIHKRLLGCSGAIAADAEVRLLVENISLLKPVTHKIGRYHGTVEAGVLRVGAGQSHYMRAENTEQGLASVCDTVGNDALGRAEKKPRRRTCSVKYKRIVGAYIGSYKIRRRHDTDACARAFEQ